MKGFALDHGGDLELRGGRIRRALLTGKHPDGETLRGELLAGLQQVDESFSLESFSCEMTSERRLLLTFSARSGSGEAVTGSRMV